MIRLEQHLERLLVITDVLGNDHHFNAERFLDYFIRVITCEKKKNSISEFLSANLSFLAFKITEHGGKRGKKYITSTREDYWSMLKSSMGGGFIVSFTALIKILITKVPMPGLCLYGGIYELPVERVGGTFIGNIEDRYWWFYS